MRTHIRAKGLVGAGGGGGGGAGGEGMMFLKIFSISLMYHKKRPFSTKKKSRTFMETGNQMQNLKIGTNSELIYEDGSI